MRWLNTHVPHANININLRKTFENICKKLFQNKTQIGNR